VTPEQLTAIIGALGTLVVAVVGLIVQLRLLRKDLNGRLSQLVETTRRGAQKQGELEGRDWTRERSKGPTGPQT
jgi:hypothetical protein